MHRRTPFDLWELQRATAFAIEKSEGITVEDLQTDFGLQLTVERILERIGEALRRISIRDPDIAAQIPDLRRAIDQRNLIAHAYYEIEWDLIYETLVTSIPDLQQVVKHIIAEHPDEMRQ